MRRSFFGIGGSIVFVLAACAQLEGLDEFEKVDCVGDCGDAGRDAARADGSNAPDAAPSGADSGVEGPTTDGEAPDAEGPDAEGPDAESPDSGPPPPSCTDGIKSVDETDVDCGGSCPKKCILGKTCSVAADCQSRVCGATKTCVPAPTCIDGIKNGTETDKDCGGICATKCAVGKGCKVDADCDRSLCTLDMCRLPKSCNELKTAVPTSQSGVYTLDPDGAGALVPFDAYCEMSSDGGGWTLALKADGNQTTFRYTAPLWTDQLLLNPTAPNLDTTEAKLASFNTIPFTAVRVVLVDNGALRSLVVPAASSSLFTLFNGASVITKLGRTSWTGLLTVGSLQPFCNAEGINVDPLLGNGASVAVRIGIVSNEQDDCNSPDSWLGIGGIGAPCGPLPDTTSVGNIAGCGADNGDINTAAFGYVFVR